MTLPDPHNPAQAPAQPPAWPMVTRTQERLLQTVWALQQARGRCFASQRYLGECIGVSQRHVRRIVNELVPRYLSAKFRGKGETLLLRTWPPQTGVELGTRQGRTFVSAYKKYKYS